MYDFILHCVSKKLYPFYFCNNFFIRELIFIIFGSNMPEEICNKIYIVFPTTPNLCAPTLPCNTSSNMTNVHRCHEFLRKPFLQTFLLKIRMIKCCTLASDEYRSPLQFYTWFDAF